MIRLLTVLLLAMALSGLPGLAGVLAAAPAGSHPRCCCAPDGLDTARCEPSVGDPECGCRVAPAPSAPARPAGFPAPQAPSVEVKPTVEAIVPAAPEPPIAPAAAVAEAPVRRTGDTPGWLLDRSLRR